jgi:hypothetical protein
VLRRETVLRSLPASPLRTRLMRNNTEGLPASPLRTRLMRNNTEAPGAFSRTESVLRRETVLRTFPGFAAAHEAHAQ